jgi:hypothetical protein
VLDLEVVARPGIQGLCQPPDPLIDRIPVGAGPRPIESLIVVQQRAEIGPGASLGDWHFLQGTAERGFGTLIVVGTVPRETFQCMAPPRGGPAAPGRDNGGVAESFLGEIAY